MTLAALSKDYDMAACPFCHKDRVRLHEYNQHGSQYRVVCLTFGCESQGPRRHDPQDAMDAWNNRRPE
jgi:hypothetical protein